MPGSVNRLQGGASAKVECAELKIGFSDIGFIPVEKCWPCFVQTMWLK